MSLTRTTHQKPIWPKDKPVISYVAGCGACKLPLHCFLSLFFVYCTKAFHCGRLQSARLRSLPLWRREGGGALCERRQKAGLDERDEILLLHSRAPEHRLDAVMAAYIIGFPPYFCVSVCLKNISHVSTCCKNPAAGDSIQTWKEGRYLDFCWISWISGLRKCPSHWIWDMKIKNKMKQTFGIKFELILDITCHCSEVFTSSWLKPDEPGATAIIIIKKKNKRQETYKACLLINVEMFRAHYSWSNVTTDSQLFKFVTLIRRWNKLLCCQFHTAVNNNRLNLIRTELSKRFSSPADLWL